MGRKSNVDQLPGMETSASDREELAAMVAQTYTDRLAQAIIRDFARLEAEIERLHEQIEAAERGWVAEIDRRIKAEKLIAQE